MARLPQLSGTRAAFGIIARAEGEADARAVTGQCLAQDGDNAPKAQNFKIVDWAKIKAALAL